MRCRPPRRRQCRSKKKRPATGLASCDFGAAASFLRLSALEVDGRYDGIGVGIDGYVLSFDYSAADVEGFRRIRTPVGGAGGGKDAASRGAPHRRSGEAADRPRRGRRGMVQLVSQELAVRAAEHSSRAAGGVAAEA